VTATTTATKPKRFSEVLSIELSAA
jgi:hypothetical protein